ncbi:protein STPG4 isoform X2 [Talpa occidentalis]|uniref:protein STPG4 isoform X2 n=1 Tax=Talpa occidentalis TaxID=50954 RepID=UPI0023F8008B|nr:protein STPG4 isoform X2 [Talpa occidentalis]
MDQSVISIPSTARPSRKASSFEREGWWRIALTNTPIPGTYHLKTFIEESLLNPVITTYNFKNEGRRKPPIVQRNNPILNDLPQYMPPDFMELLKKQVATYAFKDKPRPSPSRLVYKDQRKKTAFRSFVFRSTVQRFPSGCFIPHEGPGPGHYDLKIPSTSSITSCFQSRVPRFMPSSSKTPGPGAYTASRQFPKQPRTIAKMGREHSLFFNNTIDFLK